MLTEGGAGLSARSFICLICIDTSPCLLRAGRAGRPDPRVFFSWHGHVFMSNENGSGREARTTLILVIACFWPQGVLVFPWVQK